VVHPRNKAGEGSVWRWGRPKLQAALVEDDPVCSQVVAKRRRDGGYNVYEKHRKDTAKAKGLWDEPAMRTEQGTIDLREVLGAAAFDHPKPVALVQRCVQLATDPGGIVIDPFAGSGTTAAAVAAANAQDGGTRSCVLMQWPEPVELPGFETICDITRARVRASCGGLRVFELEDLPETPMTMHALREAEARRGDDFDPHVRALAAGVGLTARVERGGGWTVLREGERAFAWSREPGSIEGLSLPDDATVAVPDDAWSNETRVRLARRLRVESI